MQTATLWQHEHHQAVQLPQEVHLPGTAVYVKQIGNALLLLPMDHPLDPLLASLARFSEDFLAAREQLPLETRDDAMASELEPFAALCHRLGLQVTVERYAAEDSFLALRAPAAAQRAHWCLSFEQNLLYFDQQGRFLGTLGDENGAWEPRVPSPQQTAS